MSKPGKEKSPDHLPAGVTPPASPEAEQSVLGAILLRPAVLDEVADLLEAGDFYREAHRKIFRAMLELYLKNEPIDLVLLHNLLKERGQLEEIGGLQFLSGLSEHVGIAANASHYAKIVRDKAVLRRLLANAQEIAGACLGPVEDVEEFLDYVENSLLQVAEKRQSPVLSLGEIVPAEMARIEGIFYKNKEAKKEALLGVSTGFLDLDKKTGGLQPGDLILIAARPSMGKTALALNLSVNAALKSKLPSAIFSLEMTKEQLLHRMMGNVGNINVTRLRTARMENEEWSRFITVGEELEDAPIYINDASTLTPLEIRAQARRLKATEKIGLVIVDYLQLMRDPRARSREQEVSNISRSLKALAKELKLPVVALSQLNRKVEERTNKRPQLADLRESGSLEQDADLILFIYRDEIYREDSPQRGIAEINLAKQRMGPTGLVKLCFQPDYSRFRDYIEDHAIKPADAGY